MSVAGALRFGRYAFPPNRLGYCGPDEAATLRQYVAAGASDAGLVGLERRFEAAFPYLQLIARSAGIADPFDARVVQAYWVGGPLLDRVGPRDLDASLQRFRSQIAPRDLPWLRRAVEGGARPHHDFHVFDVYRRTAAMRTGLATPLLEIMDGCRISWGRVVEARPLAATVRRSTLVLRDGRLQLGDELDVSVETYGDPLRVDDVVALHWGWVCERLDERDLRSLRAETARAIDLANVTV